MTNDHLSLAILSLRVSFCMQYCMGWHHACKNTVYNVTIHNIYLRQGGYVFASFCLSVCLSVCRTDNSKSYGRILLKFWGHVGHGINYQWLNFGGDPAGILDAGSLWNFHCHCIKVGITEPLAKQRWWHHLVNSFALAKVPALSVIPAVL